VIGFAGAVTMIPGLSLYRALVGVLQMARLASTADAATVDGTLGNALQGCLVVSGLALGFIVGARAVLAMVGEPAVATGSHSPDDCDEATQHLPAKPDQHREAERCRTESVVDDPGKD
jgi:hypothetical protein